jgi:agmatinase
VKKTIAKVPRSEGLYVTIDIDVLDPAAAPGTGTPEPGGLWYVELRSLLRELPRRGPILGIDLVELNPLSDPFALTARTASLLLLDLLSSIFDKSRR